MGKKFIALLLCLAMVAGMTALVSADTVVDPVSITFEEFFGMNNLSGFNPYYFNVTDDGSVKKIEATKYDKGQPASYQFNSRSPLDINTEYKLEWEWKAENSSPVSKIELGNTNWTSFTYNG